MTNDVMYAKEDSFIEKSLVTKSECFNENYWIIPLKDSFVEVVYTDDELLLRPIIYNKDENIVKFGEVGKYKSTIWEFQKEIRFKLVVLPTKDRDGIKLNPMNDFGRIMLEKIDPPFQNYNIEIRKEAYELMEITLGPKCNLAEEIIVESLIQKFNPKAKINRNKYKGLIR